MIVYSQCKFLLDLRIKNLQTYYGTFMAKPIRYCSRCILFYDYPHRWVIRGARVRFERTAYSVMSGVL